MESVSLTPQDMRATAVLSLQSGNAARALALSEALLVRDSQDPVALRIGGQAALEIGRSDVAAQRGRTLFLMADTDEKRFFAARLVALSYVQENSFTRAQIWLRRARQNAPDAASAASIGQDYNAVRQRNPIRFQLDSGVQSSSNINNGSSEDTFDLLGLTFVLPPSAQSLSGYRISADATLAYTLNENADSRTVVSMTGQAVRYTLSDDAKAAAPSFDVRTLAYDRAILGVRHDWRAGVTRQPLTATFNYGISQIDGDFYAHDLELGLSSQWVATQRTRLSAGVRLGRVTYANSGFSSDSWAVDLGWTYALNGGDSVVIQGSVGQNQSDDAVFLNSDKQDINVTYNFGNIADTFDVSVGMGVQWRNFEPTFSAPDGRKDLRTDVTLSVGLPKIELYGFSPVAELEAYQTNSNVSRYQSDGVSLDFSIRSNL